MHGICRVRLRRSSARVSRCSRHRLSIAARGWSGRDCDTQWVAYVETRSLNTAENAQYSQQILEPLGIGQVVIVTNAWHMPRAVASFEREGFDIGCRDVGVAARFSCGGGAARSLSSAPMAKERHYADSDRLTFVVRSEFAQAGADTDQQSRNLSPAVD